MSKSKVLTDTGPAQEPEFVPPAAGGSYINDERGGTLTRVGDAAAAGPAEVQTIPEEAP